ncbi:MAG TPA: cupin domain-containing protein [Rhizomicrobium sp.]|nr:cupin domain-containing protein [Rhizomicrobium sp.]
MKNASKLAACALALLAVPALAQDRKVYLSWAPKAAPVPYVAPNKPVTRLDQVLAKHAGQKSWTEDSLETERYSAKWIQMAPGEKTRTQFYGDDRTVWVVWGGKIRFTIKGQQPFVASKGFLVQVPLRVPYSMETVGNEPSLRFEITRAHSLPSYPVDARDAFGAPPPPRDGQHYVKVSYPTMPVGGGMGTYDDKNPVYMDFMKDYVQDDPTASGKGRLHLFVNDADNQAAIIRGKGVAIPPDSNKGHFHIQNEEFWFILEGKIGYQIEGIGLVVAQAGDVVLATPNRWHRASFAPGQVDTRLAFNRSPTMLHNYDENANGTQ